MKLSNDLKTYSELEVIERKDSKYVKKKIHAIEEQFYSVAEKYIDAILFPEFFEDGFAFFKYYFEGNIVGKNKDVFIKAIRSIAAVHNSLTPGNFKFLPKATKSAYSQDLQHLEELLSLQEKEKINNTLKYLLQGLDHLDLNYVIHEDFIALNVVVENSDVKIIDWDYVRVDFAEKDVGRFIGDLFFKDPNFEHRYYPFIWREDLIEAYLKKRKELNNQFDIERSYKNILFAEKLNYIYPVISCLENKIENMWYKANFEALAK